MNQPICLCPRDLIGSIPACPRHSPSPPSEDYRFALVSDAVGDATADLTEDHLDAIRRRDADTDFEGRNTCAEHDRRTLLAELDRLREVAQQASLAYVTESRWADPYRRGRDA
jgi:hypothetical protein